MIERRRYTTIEGMRGIAAIAVVLGHAGPLVGAAVPMSSYLAVDLFFVISGFVMAHAYGGRLQHGMSGWAFLRDRIIRLYPLYILGTLSGVAFSILSLLRHTDTLWNFTQPLISLPLALFMLPSPVSSVLFPLNVPAWSLLLELVANAVFAVAWLRRGPVLLALAGVAAVALLYIGDVNVGWGKEWALGGLARVGFSFPVGVLLYRVHRRWRLPPAASLAPVLVLIACLWFAPTHGQFWYDLAFVFGVSPLLVLAGAACNPSSARLTRFFVVLGALSYPLYALHHPALMASIGTIERHVPPGLAAFAAGWGFVALLVIASYGASKLDVYVRAGLRRLPRRLALGAEPG